MAPPTTKRPIIIMTTGFEKPDKASSGLSIPKRTSNSKEDKATKSDRIFPNIKNMDDITRIIKVVYIL